MPSCPGSWLRIMQAQAGTVIGGWVLRSGPWEPASIRPLRLGRSSRNRSKTRRGAAQSSPRTATFMTGEFLPAPGPLRFRSGLDRRQTLGRRELLQRGDRDVSQRLKAEEDPPGAVERGLAVRLDHQLGHERRLVRIGHSGEVVQRPGQGLLVEPLDVAADALLERAVD